MSYRDARLLHGEEIDVDVAVVGAGAAGIALAMEFAGDHARVALGASPRATLSLVQAAKAWALQSGRAFLVPDDLRAVAADT